MDADRQHRTFEGTVVSDRMEKTIVVTVDRRRVHPKYRKAYRLSRRFKVHDPKNAAHVGDRVQFIETRPLSKEKRWKLLAIISRSAIPSASFQKESKNVS